MASSSESNSSRIGTIVGARYELLRLLGEGGQGSVYAARDLEDGDQVAIKVLHRGAAASDDARERLFREAHAMATLGHTSAVNILDQKFTDDGALALVMEFLDGVDLERYLARFVELRRQLPLEYLEQIMSPIVATLEVAHGMGILHRDIKPSNVFVLTDGSVRLLDFGFAKFLRMPALTAQGFVAGSPGYIAPELWLGKAPDPRADVYSLAAVVFRCLAGRPPFHGTSLHDVAAAAVEAPRPSLTEPRPDLPERLDDWALAALAADPTERFESVRGLWTAFRLASGLAD